MSIVSESEKMCPPEYMKRNYQKEMDVLLAGIEKRIKAGGRVPTLLLHSCCAPCSSYVISYLSDFFKITVFYYNPNITEEKEYKRRVEEQKRFINEFNAKNDVRFLEGDYTPDNFMELSKGLENCPEGGLRCAKCFRMRLEETAKKAGELKFDYFTTTLTISPVKSAALLNSIGDLLGKTYGTRYLMSDFKKKGGYALSVGLSEEYGLYRQDYCGCVFSKEERQKQRISAD